jgi:hypothetical protein
MFLLKGLSCSLLRWRLCLMLNLPIPIPSSTCCGDERVNLVFPYVQACRVCVAGFLSSDPLLSSFFCTFTCLLSPSSNSSTTQLSFLFRLDSHHCFFFFFNALTLTFLEGLPCWNDLARFFSLLVELCPFSSSYTAVDAYGSPAHVFSGEGASNTDGSTLGLQNNTHPVKKLQSSKKGKERGF